MMSLISKKNNNVVIGKLLWCWRNKTLQDLLLLENNQLRGLEENVSHKGPLGTGMWASQYEPAVYKMFIKLREMQTFFNLLTLEFCELGGFFPPYCFNLTVFNVYCFLQINLTSSGP